MLTHLSPRDVKTLKGSMHQRSALGLVIVTLSAGWLYWPVLTKLVSDWKHDDNYSHGFLIVPLAGFFVWERREALARAVVQPSVVGLAVVFFALALLIAGTLGAELLLTRVSLIACIAGTVLFLWGRQHLRILAFPIALLLLMVPIPAIVFNVIAFPLQLLASRLGTAAIQACAIPVLREGNVIVLANTSLEVAEACSGIRSLVSLLTLGIVYGYFIDPRTWFRILIALATVPIAILVNGLRVAGTGIAAHYYGPQAAQGFFHTFSGWLVFVVAFLALSIVTSIVQRMWPPVRIPPSGTAVLA